MQHACAGAHAGARREAIEAAAHGGYVSEINSDDLDTLTGILSLVLAARERANP